MAAVLPAREVHVWFARPSLHTEAQLASCTAVLADDERAHVARFRFERHRREATVSRALVRTTLARYLDEEPSAFRYAFGAHGRPRLAPPNELDFNATNHPELVAVAVARGAVVGIDVEPTTRGEEILEVAHDVFSAPEREALAALSGAARRDRAVSLWTLKEAYLKARGLGLSAPLRDIVIDFPAPDRPRVRLLAGRDDAPSWSLATRDVEGFRIALAVDAVRTIVVRESD